MDPFDPTAASVGLQAGLIGLAGGILLGFAARIGDFCTLGALETAMLGRDYRRIHIWAVGLGVAILGTHVAHAAGLLDLERTFYHSIAWNPVASIAGGLIFGYGMAMAGNCGFGALLRAGGGDVRSIVIVVVLGISAFFTLSGPLGPLRAMVFPQRDQLGPSGIAHALSSVSGLPMPWIATAIAAGLTGWGLSHPAVRRSWMTIACAAGVGLSVVWGFVGTTLISRHSFDAIFVEGPSFTAPVGRTVLYLMTSTGTAPSFSVGSVIGTLLGAFVASMWANSFRWEVCDDPRELGRQLAGAVLMGVGGVIAIGCTIGQGLSGFAALAWSGPTTLAAIAFGSYVGLMGLVAQSNP